MPHVWDMLSRFSRPEVRGGKHDRFSVVAAATWYSFRVALAAFAIGVAARHRRWRCVMARFRLLERGLMPYLIMSQTVPLIALGSARSSVGAASSHLGRLEWQRWMSASLLGAFLAFFPVAVGTLRGLQSTPPASMELMDSLAAPWWQHAAQAAIPGRGAVHRAGAASWPAQRRWSVSSWPRSRPACRAASVG